MVKNVHHQSTVSNMHTKKQHLTFHVLHYGALFSIHVHHQWTVIYSGQSDVITSDPPSLSSIISSPVVLVTLLGMWRDLFDVAHCFYVNKTAGNVM